MNRYNNNICRHQFCIISYDLVTVICLVQLMSKLENLPASPGRFLGFVYDFNSVNFPLHGDKLLPA